MELYSAEEITAQKGLRNRFRAAMIIVSAAAALFCFALFLTVNPLNESRYRIFACIAAGLAGCFDIYVSSFIMPYLRPKPKKRSAWGKVLHVLSNIFHQMHMYGIWIILSAIIVSFIFNQLTDTVPQKKVQIYVDAPVIREAELEYELDKDLPEGIKLVKVHPVDYSMFGTADPAEIDILIVRRSWMEEHAEMFEMQGELCRSGGTGNGAAASYIGYLEGDYYLVYGPDSPHAGGGGAAEYVAARFLELE